MANGYLLLHRRIREKLFGAIMPVFLLSILPLPSIAQDRVTIENPFSSVTVVKDQKSGRFWFATGARHGHTRYLYHGGKTATTVTSNVIFRVQRGNEFFYFCNTPDPFSNGGYRPEAPGGIVPFLPYDSLYVSPGLDTMEVRWKQVAFAYDITMRFVAERPRHEYDDGADILLEFDYKLSGYVPGSTDLGIFLMLDGDNGMITAAVPSDHSSIMTPSRYFSKYDPGKSYQKRYDEIPEWYLTGWFEYSRPPSEVFSMHRLIGKSLGGAPLTTPDRFAIGNWKDFRRLSWGFNADLTVKQIQDVATAMRWENLGGEGKIRTAFGTTSRAGNNLYLCRGDNLFAAIRTERVVTQEVINGPYTPMQFDVEMWVANVDWQDESTSEFTLTTPIASLPSGSGRLWLDPSTISVFLRPHEAKKVTWRVNVDPTLEDTLAILNIEGLYCAPLVNFKGAYVPDTRPPVVEAVDNGRDVTAWWRFRAFDRRPDFRHDSGIDSIRILRNDDDNFRLVLDPVPFRRCDTSATLNIRAEVIDTTKAGNIVFRVHDCKGNVRDDSARYLPRPDIFSPEVVGIDSLDRVDPAGYPCAVRTFEVYLDDRRNQRPEAGDAGFGSISVLRSANFDPIELNFDRGVVPVRDFDDRASFRLRVSDTLFDAEAEVVMEDYAGNADTLHFRYCTLPDVRPPVLVAAPVPGAPVRSWTVEASDSGAWDRGLLEVVEISRINMAVSPWPVVIAPGQPDVGGITVGVVDDVWDGELTLEFRDRYFVQSDPSTHAAHSSRVSFTFNGLPDTIPPNVVFQRDLSVPVSEVVFSVFVNDSNYVGGDLYRYDHGLLSVTWTLTPNMRVRTPIVFTDNRHGAAFQVEIIDPLTIVAGDTVCVTAIDSAGNPRVLCQPWPSEPDGKSPIFVGVLDRDRTRITGLATDDREYDRGLGSVTLRNETNLRPFSLGGLAGARSAPIEIDVIDPEKPVAGELVVRDLVGELEPGAEQGIHTVVIPFRLGAGEVHVELPELVEGGQEIEGTIRATSSFSGDDVEEFSFTMNHSSNGALIAASTSGGAGSFNAVPQGAGGVAIDMATKPGMTYAPGEALGTIRFSSAMPDAAERFSVQVDPVSVTVNDERERVIEVRTPGDPLASELRLPPPFMKIEGNAQTVINGDCNRVLGSGDPLSRPSGLAILGAHPQPVMDAGGGQLRLYVRDLPAEGATMTLVSPIGSSMLETRVESGSNEAIAELAVRLPDQLPAGIYFLYLAGSTGTDRVKVVVVR